MDEQGARKALQHERHTLGTRAIRPEYAKSSVEFQHAQGLSATRLHIAEVPSDVSIKDLRRYFGKFGDLVDVFKAPDKARGKNPALGLVTFQRHRDAAAAVKCRHSIDGHRLSVCYARLRPGEGKPLPMMMPFHPGMAFPMMGNPMMPFGIPRRP